MTANILDCFLIPLNRFEDNRGSFTKVFSEQLRQDFNFEIQEFCVAEIEPKVWRSGKINKPPFTAAKIFYCIKGSVKYRIGDLRKDSDSYNCCQDFELSRECPQVLYMPKGCVNWEISENGATIVYAQDAVYDKGTEVLIDMDLFMKSKVII